MAEGASGDGCLVEAMVALAWGRILDV